MCFKTASIPSTVGDQIEKHHERQVLGNVDQPLSSKQDLLRLLDAEFSNNLAR